MNGVPAWWAPGASIRRRLDGQLAEAAILDGFPVAEVNRGTPSSQTLAALPDEWEPVEREPIHYTSLIVARIVYEADRALRLVRRPGIREWIALRENERIAFRDHLARERLYTDGWYLGPSGSLGPAAERRELDDHDRERLTLMNAILGCFEITDMPWRVAPVAGDG